MLGLVGKGVTFDTGGISIKPAEGMERMKDDMAGGAAVVCAMRAIALLKAPINVIGIVPTTENMPGGRAVKPGDVLTSRVGQDGRSDQHGRGGPPDPRRRAVVRAQAGRDAPRRCRHSDRRGVVALGKAASALFGRPQSWVDAVGRAARRAGDRCWPMPLYDEYADQIRSEIADIMNTGGRPAGACTAAIFLKEFAGGRAVGPSRRRRNGLGRRGEAVDAQGGERRRGPHARGARLHRIDMDMMVQQANPIIVHVIETPVRSTTVPTC